MRFVNFALITGAMLASVATAQAAPVSSSVTGTVDINGSVADRCLFTIESKVISVGELSRTGTGANAGKLNTSKLDGESRNLAGWCNGTAASMTVEALPLVNTSFTGTAPTGFDTVINYTASALANDVTAIDDSSVSGEGSPVTVGLFTGDVLVSLSGSSTPSSGLLVAGDYSGQVLVTLTPNVSLGGPAS